MNSLKNCSGAHCVPAGTGISLSKKISIAFTGLFITAALLQSCGHSREQMEYAEASKAVADSVAGYVPGLATDTINGVTHNFIRNASLKCRVNDVLQATKDIEDLVALNGGYASKSDLSSNVEYHTSIHFKKDSVMEQTHYTTVADMTLRVPNRQLDTVLRKITGMAAFVDYRTLRSDDVKTKLFANSLAERRLQEYKKRVENKSDAKDHKLNQSVAAEEQLLNKQTTADEKRVETYELADQVNYSTLVIEVYEPQKITSFKRAVPLSVEPYEPSFAEKFGAAFLQGFQLLKRFILFLTESWSVFFIAFVLFFTGRKALRFYNRHYAVSSK